MSIGNKALSSLLGLLILTSIGAIVYVTQSPPIGDRFTEFYIVGLEGKAEAYPEELGLGEEGRVILGIVNREYQDMRYRVEIRLAGTPIGGLGPVLLQHGQEWKQEMNFIAENVGANQKLEFLLFREEENEPYSSLRLWLDVKEPG